MRFQALHSDDVEAYRLAVVEDRRGASNAAADPMIDSTAIGQLLGARGRLVQGVGDTTSRLAPAPVGGWPHDVATGVG